jgi:hypothetical protein
VGKRFGSEVKTKLFFFFVDAPSRVLIRRFIIISHTHYYSK